MAVVRSGLNRGFKPGRYPRRSIRSLEHLRAAVFSSLQIVII
jgi:hypothetical protein